VLEAIKKALFQGVCEEYMLFLLPKNMVLTSKDGAEYEANNKERERLSRQILKSCEVSQYLKLMKAILLEQDRKKKNGKKLNCSDEKNLQRAEKMLISEFAVVFNITVEKARSSVFEAVFDKEMDA
jgi:RNA polymerase-interacting CarD/CdnL/TRCF family regulator